MEKWIEFDEEKPKLMQPIVIILYKVDVEDPELKIREMPFHIAPGSDFGTFCVLAGPDVCDLKFINGYIYKPRAWFPLPPPPQGGYHNFNQIRELWNNQNGEP